MSWYKNCAYGPSTSMVIWYMMRGYGSKTIYYYTNLGIAPKTLWKWSIALDLTIFLICVTAATIIKLLWTA